ncbi:MAG: G5 domain-containing protein [Faecousia sp.]
MLESHSQKLFVIKRSLMLLIPTLCLLLLVTQTVFAKNTYRIHDSGRVMIHTTYATDPAKVLDEIGLELGVEDTYTTQNGPGVSEITVQRKQTISIQYGEQLLEVISYGETVESLLNRLDLTVNLGDIVSLPMNTQTYDGMVLTISRSASVEETYTREIPFETVYCYDASLPLGAEVVLTEGIVGRALCTASVCYTDGREVSRTVLSETVTQQPVDALVAVGTGGQDIPQISAGGQLIVGNGVITTPTGEVLSYVGKMELEATAYTSTDPGCNEITATGTFVHMGVVAVDPDLIPYGTRMFIVSNDGKFIYGIATAEDCGGDILGNRIDLYYETELECLIFGRRDVTVYFLG